MDSGQLVVISMIPFRLKIRNMGKHFIYIEIQVIHSFFHPIHPFLYPGKFYIRTLAPSKEFRLFPDYNLIQCYCVVSNGKAIFSYQRVAFFVMFCPGI